MQWFIHVPRLCWFTPMVPVSYTHLLGPRGVGERQLLQVMCAYRLLLPQAGITISSRERAGFRDQVMRCV